MPELPEVETIARHLHPLIAGRRIASIDALWARSVDHRSPPIRTIEGDTIAGVRRLGKFVAIELASGRTLTIHLRMTGRLIVDAPEALPHTRIAFAFAGGGTLTFSDARKFGRLRVVEGDARAVLGIGVDPFAAALTPARLRELMRGSRANIKAWLLDQRKLAGVGNIYACEGLFDARIRPTRKAGRLSAPERLALLRSLRKVMRKAIFYRGSSVDDYVDAEGKPGEFQKKLAVYGRGGLPCRRCKAIIRRVVLAQRGTFFCPVCQH